MTHCTSIPLNNFKYIPFLSYFFPVCLDFYIITSLRFLPVRIVMVKGGDVLLNVLEEH